MRPSALWPLAAGALAQDRACNSSPALCSRPYNNITFLGAHDSPFVRNASNLYSISGDQFYGSIQQLDSGVRLLTAQIHSVKNDYHLCHTSCALYDAGPVTSWLSSLKSWLDRNPNDVVTILLVNSDNLDAATLNGLWTKAGIVPYGYVPASTTAPQTQWPTLGQMIDSGKRLVTYMAGLDPATNKVAPYLLNEFTFAFENSYENDKPNDFSCDISRPDNLRAGGPAAAISAGYLPLMNHFLYDKVGSVEFPSVENVEKTNSDGNAVGNLGAAANNCTKVYGGRPPTYMLADFVNVGPALDTADRLNGIVGNVQGRKPLPNTVLGLVSSSAASSASATMATTADPMPAALCAAESGSGGSCSVAPTGPSGRSGTTPVTEQASIRSPVPTNAALSPAPTSTSLAHGLVSNGHNPGLLVSACIAILHYLF